MNKTEFLNALRDKLTQDYLGEAKVNEHMRYYENYISQEIQSGRSEREVIDELGDPLLLARTILDTSGGSESGEFHTESSSRSGVYNDPEQESNRTNNSGFQMNSRWGCFAAAVIIILIILFVFWIVGSVVSAVLPILFPVLIVLFIFTLIKQRR